ncbi:MAG: hypothetical protein IJV77_08125 [Clostridia bacterium]|nr:hypothetical protein [Clostridia bacterium]
MKIKNKFNVLKKYFEKEYCFRNGEEELIFFQERHQIEIFSNGIDLIDLVICDGQKRLHYLQSPFFEYDEKEKIKNLLNSSVGLDYKCSCLCNIIENKIIELKNKQKPLG